jgi:sugar phosphate isomerase/epimerase
MAPRPGRQRLEPPRGAPRGAHRRRKLNDGTLIPENPDYLADCLANRRPLGEGAFDLARLVALLRSKAIEAPLSVEVISDELDRLPPARAVRRVVESTRVLLESVPH